MTDKKFRINLTWLDFSSGSSQARVPYGLIFIKKIGQDGEYTVEMNGDLLKARPRTLEEAKELATVLYSDELENFLFHYSNIATDHLTRSCKLE